MLKKSLGFVIATTALGATGITNASEFEVTVTNITSGIHFTPLIVSAHTPAAAMFSTGTHASSQLQAIAEGGDVSGMAALLESIGASVATGDGLLAPGASASFTVNSSSTNTVLSLTGMLLPTNDGFVGLNSVSLPTSMGTTMTYTARGYDAGTEGNDEVVGSGAPGEAGFPAPPPVVASGTGTGATGIHTEAEGFVTVHRGVIGDLDATGGFSDINAAEHRWQNPVATVTVRMIGGADNSGDNSGDNTGSGPSPVSNLSGLVYSRSAVELFWEPAVSADSTISAYEIKRDGELVETRDGTSYFNEGLSEDTEYTFNVRAIDANGNASEYQSVVLRTNP